MRRHEPKQRRKRERSRTVRAFMVSYALAFAVLCGFAFLAVAALRPQEKPELVQERFRVQDTSLRGEALLEAVCRGRGFLMRGGVCDYDRCCAVVLDEFRAGKCGRITLELPRRPQPRMTLPGAEKREAAEDHAD